MKQIIWSSLTVVAMAVGTTFAASNVLKQESVEIRRTIAVVRPTPPAVLGSERLVGVASLTGELARESDFVLPTTQPTKTSKKALSRVDRRRQ